LKLAFWGAAVGSKEHAVTAPAALVLIEIALFTGWTRRNLWIGGAVMGAGLLGALGFLYSHPAYLVTDGPKGFSVVDRLLTEPRVFWHYLSLLVWPDADRLRVNYDWLASQGLFTPPITALALATTIVLTVAAIRYLRSWPWLGLGWLFWLIAHSVESSVILLALAFEHRIYLPSTLLIAGVVATVFQLWPARWACSWLHVGILVLAAALAYQTVERNRTWADRERLWGHDMALGAEPRGVGRNAAIAAIAKGAPERALPILDGVEVKDPFVQAKLDQIRARALLAAGRYKAAESKLQSILAEFENDGQTHHLYVRLLVREDRLNDARDMLARMHTFVSDSFYTALAQAEVARAVGEPAEAISRLRDWLKAHPDAGAMRRKAVRLHLAHSLAANENGDEAAELYRQIVGRHPQAWNAWRGLLRVLAAGGSEAAAEEIRQHLRIRGVDPEV